MSQSKAQFRSPPGQCQNSIEIFSYNKLELSYKVFQGPLCTPVKSFLCNYVNIIKICLKLVFIFKIILKIYL